MSYAPEQKPIKIRADSAEWLTAEEVKTNNKHGSNFAHLIWKIKNLLESSVLQSAHRAKSPIYGVR